MEFVALALTLAFGAGIAPGPLTALIVSATLERGLASGVRVALAPLITDAPVIALSVTVLDAAPDAALDVVAVLGGLFVVYLGVEAYRAEPPDPTAESAPSKPLEDLRRGALVNIASPHPWLFWIGVGGPIMLDAADRAVGWAVAFVAVFYVVLETIKIGIAAGVAGGRKRLLGSRGYTVALRISALLMVAAGVVLALEGLS